MSVTSFVFCFLAVARPKINAFPWVRARSRAPVARPSSVVSLAAPLCLQDFDGLLRDLSALSYRLVDV